MRLLLSLSLVLVLATPAWSQSPAGTPDNDSRPDPIAEEATAGPAGESRPEAAELAELRAESRTASATAAPAAAQRTAEGFLYHVLLTAVTALITALIWRAVF